MNQNKVIKYLVFAVVVLFLTILAWWAIEGALRQWSHSETFGQKLETTIQLFCGIMSLLTASTLFWWQHRARPIRLSWAISLVGTVGLSSLVWGPPMLLISFAFTGVALLLAWGIIAAIRVVEKQ